jgi:serine acetyltransferase
MDAKGDDRTRAWSKSLQDLAQYEALRAGERGGRSPGGLLVTALRSPGWWQLVIHRVLHASARRGRRDAYRRRERFMIAALWPLSTTLKLLTKNELMEFTAFEGGVYLSNAGGIVLGARRVGRGTLIHHNVTIGMNVASGAVPEIGREVWIGHDSVIHGEITIGDGATILPGSVLTRSVADATLVRGNPASIVARNFDNHALRASTRADPDLPEPRASLRDESRQSVVAAGTDAR